MRFAAIVIAAALATSVAKAGSLQTLPELDAAAPSMVVLGTQANLAEHPSMLVLGQPLVSDERVASVGSERTSKRRPNLQPVLIRGGESTGGE